jgi:hypothetical protein
LKGTIDEQTGVAYNAVRLDEHFQGEPVQTREPCGYESNKFLAYFERFGGMELLHGGYESALHNVQLPELRPTRLFCIDQRRAHDVIRISELNPQTITTVYQDRVYVLVDYNQRRIKQFNGTKSLPRERSRAAQFVRMIDTNGGDNYNITVSDSVSDFPHQINVLETGTQVNTENTENGGGATCTAIKVWRWTDVLFEPIADTRQGFNSIDFVIVDDTDANKRLWVWIGKNSKPHFNLEPVNAIELGTVYLVDNSIDTINTSIVKVSQSHEPDEFKTLVGWSST